jgi:LysR family transcriptional regulator, regulator for bpeEF and oprC
VSARVDGGKVLPVAARFNRWLNAGQDRRQPIGGQPMDKLRALQYFVSAAERRSLSAAARHHGVSVAAVSKLIVALEAHLKATLLERGAQGITLTAAGSAYLEACRPALAQLHEADEQAAAGAAQTQGTVVVAVQPVIAQEVLTAALPRFNALYPDIQLDIRFFLRMSEEQDQGVDAILVMGWPQNIGDLVCRQLCATSFVIVAAPSYWAAHGLPRHPSELEHHNCLCIRSNTGSVMDLWTFRKDDERVTVQARGWLVSDNVHRDMVRDLIIAGVGVGRLLDWHQRPGAEVPHGLMVPALTDWLIDEVPPVNLLYPPSARRVPRVRIFLDWVTQVFADVESQRRQPLPATPMPRWVVARKLRASAAR